MVIRKVLSVLCAAIFCLEQLSWGQSQPVLPAAGEPSVSGEGFQPALLKGLKVYPKEPLRFDFILDPGMLPAPDLRKESEKLVRYFLASLTVPEKDLWVNLSPYEKDRIIPEAFGQTEMGRDLLEEDYILKQLTSSLLHPEGETGKRFWQKVYAGAQEKYGTTDIPIDTFNKVWIVPDKAVVYGKAGAGAVYIAESRLKVMLEADYLAEAKGDLKAQDSLSDGGAHDMARAVLREVVIPVLEKEVNEGESFARLRQVYQSLILATWYKKKIRQSLLSEVYVDRNKTAGVNIDDPKEAEKIWQRYVESFRQGAYELVREETDAVGYVLPRRYFSGGWSGRMIIDSIEHFDAPEEGREYRLSVALHPADSSMETDNSSIDSIRKNVEFIFTEILRHSSLRAVADKIRIHWQAEGPADAWTDFNYDMYRTIVTQDSEEIDVEERSSWQERMAFCASVHVLESMLGLVSDGRMTQEQLMAILAQELAHIEHQDALKAIHSPAEREVVEIDAYSRAAEILEDMGLSYVHVIKAYSNKERNNLPGLNRNAAISVPISKDRVAKEIGARARKLGFASRQVSVNNVSALLRRGLMTSGQILGEMADVFVSSVPGQAQPQLSKEQQEASVRRRESLIKGGNVTAAFAEEKIIGYIIHSIDERSGRGYVQMMAVHDDFKKGRRGGNVGTLLMDAAGEWFRSRHVQKVLVEPEYGSGGFYNKYFTVTEFKNQDGSDVGRKVVDMAGWPVGVQQEDSVGGIDLNPEGLEFSRMGNQIDFSSANDFSVAIMRVDGFTPVVLAVSPLTKPLDFLFSPMK